MSIELDINVLPIYRREAQPQSYLPGVYVAAAPRRAARGRKNDRLVVYLDIEGELRLGREQQTKLLEGAAQTFFDTSGSVTSALRTVVEALNEVVLRRNLHGGQPVTAYLNLAVVREDKLYIAQAGATHGFLFAAGGMEYFHDAAGAGRGLGVARTPEMKLFQIDLSHGAFFVIVPRVPSSWDQTTIQAAFGQPLSVAARRFYEDAKIDLKAVIIEARSGSGQIKALATNAGIGQTVAKPQPVGAQPPITRSTPQAPPVPSAQGQPVATQQDEQPAGAAQRLRERAAQALSTVRPQRQKQEIPEAEEAQAGSRGDALKDETPDMQQARMTETPDLPSREPRKKVGDVLLNMLRGVGRFLTRMLPDEEALRIPSWVMAAIAIGVPLVLGSIALVMYVNVGRDQLYDLYYQQATVAVQVATAQGDGPETRVAWEQVLLLVEKTELYGETEETTALRSQAQGILDKLEGIERLVFEPAIVGLLNPVIRIEEMVVVNDDLYMLDINSGNVFRAWKTGSGDLEMDSSFDCGPGQYGGLIVGPLIDVVALSKFNDMNAAVLAMDGNGNLVYCKAGEGLTAMQLEPPDSLWGEPQAMALDGGDLYILDPLTNAVWVYAGEDEVFISEPRFFFAAEVPSLQSVIDMVVNGEDLFLLHEDGLLTHCVFNNLRAAPTTCNDALYSIDQMDADGQSPLANVVLGELSRRLPPDPALFFLEPTTQSLYMFGVRLHFERQFRAAEILAEGEATAFAVSNSRAIFIAVGNKIFKSTLP